MTDLRTQSGIDAANDAPFYEARYGKWLQRYFRTRKAAETARAKYTGHIFEVPSGGGMMFRLDTRVND